MRRLAEWRCARRQTSIVSVGPSPEHASVVAQVLDKMPHASTKCRSSIVASKGSANVTPKRSTPGPVGGRHGRGPSRGRLKRRNRPTVSRRRRGRSCRRNLRRRRQNPGMSHRGGSLLRTGPRLADRPRPRQPAVQQLDGRAESVLGVKSNRNSTAQGRRLARFEQTTGQTQANGKPRLTAIGNEQPPAAPRGMCNALARNLRADSRSSSVSAGWRLLHPYLHPHCRAARFTFLLTLASSNGLN